MKVLNIIALSSFLSLSIITGIAFAGAGHGSSESVSAGHGGSGHGVVGHHSAAVGSVGKASEVSRTIAVVMMDNYYEPEKIDIKAGETVRFKVANKGTLVHEFNIGTAAMHEGHQQEMMMMIQHGIIQGGKLNREMMKMDMGNGQTMEHNDPNSVLLAPGETAEIIWTFPSDAELEFACNVPGHYQSGMVGDITIK
ncbi:cupredoxin family protein [Vibrio kanaloae]|jgi:uncharacterized cupredoxin-like copper-binding protein|uniref:cupredoxin domain-containing protein n=1 Tax=Vibrio TaxID=662 RepID=UPI0020801C27|nr:copper-binding protein [Vibrio cholerae]|tara:strand:+ start:421 stop:1008 length:588 start_codon:yes stop_codon:yes gene_type:complete